MSGCPEFPVMEDRFLSSAPWRLRPRAAAGSHRAARGAPAAHTPPTTRQVLLLLLAGGAAVVAVRATTARKRPRHTGHRRPPPRSDDESDGVKPREDSRTVSSPLLSCLYRSSPGRRLQRPRPGADGDAVCSCARATSKTHKNDRHRGTQNLSAGLRLSCRYVDNALRRPCRQSLARDGVPCERGSVCL